MSATTRRQNLQWDAPASVTLPGAPDNVALWKYCIRLGYAEAARLLDRPYDTVRRACHTRFQDRNRDLTERQQLASTDAVTINYMRFRPWKRCEDNDLIVGLEMGLTIKELAGDLMRTERSVELRVRVLRDNGRLPAALLRKINRQKEAAHAH
jgi:hypothetical protein